MCYTEINNRPVSGISSSIQAAETKKKTRRSSIDERDHFLERKLDLSFPKGERPTEQVTLPHTWNAVDGMDGNGSYLRTTGVYTRTFTQPSSLWLAAAPTLRCWQLLWPQP